MSGVPDQLYFGNGDGTFKEVSSRLKSRPSQPTNGVVACDYDNDGDLDIFVSHYGVSIGLGWRTLWENDGSGNFTDVAQKRGFNANATGNSWLQTTGKGKTAQPGAPSTYVGSNGFGIDCTDIDGDGQLDIWLATISHPVDSDESRKWSDPSMLLVNKGEAGGFSFVNATLEHEAPVQRGRHRRRGDRLRQRRAHRSLGHARQEVRGQLRAAGPEGLVRADAPERRTARSRAWAWRAASTIATAPLDRVKAGQNLRWADIDGDGDLDLLVGGRDNGGGGRANFLFENTIGKQNGWVGVRLDGDGVNVNRDAIGARVTLQIAGGVLTREVQSARGLWNAADTRVLHFGLADVGCATGMQVRWPDGRVDSIDPSALTYNRYHTISYQGGLVVDP